MVHGVVAPDEGTVVTDPPEVVGLFDGALLVALELPQPASAKVPTRTSNQKPRRIVLIILPFESGELLPCSAPLSHSYTISGR
jgi:hypothetical protein